MQQTGGFRRKVQNYLLPFCASIILCVPLFGLQASSTAVDSKIHPAVYTIASRPGLGGDLKAWVLFTDKGTGSTAATKAAVDNLASRYNDRAIRRRQLRRTLPGLFDVHDLPVSSKYLQAVSAAGVDIKRTSKWINGVSVVASPAQLERIAELSFVRAIQPVRRGRKIKPIDVEPSSPLTVSGSSGRISGAGLDYGFSQDQLEQINLIAVHDQGFTGAGVVIGILDTGFIRSHDAFNHPDKPLTVLAEFDFVNNDSDTSLEPGDFASQSNHGTYILGTLGGYLPGQYIGAAHDASFILCKTEDVTAEYIGEEDNYVAGLEFIEANGGDVVTASVGYIDWYTQSDLNGLTAITTQAVNIATGNGLYCVNAAGNAGHDANPSTSALIAPADAFEVITCGAVGSTGAIASFSSDGPTADGRVKPELMARGVSTQTVSPSDDSAFIGVSGTSLSTPLIAGVVACVVQAHPEWTVGQMRTHLFLTASVFQDFGTFDPLFVQGYGIVNASAALAFQDCNQNGISDAVDIADETSNDSDGDGVPDECQDGACCTCGPTGTCVDTTLEQCNTLGGYFTGNTNCGLITCSDPQPANDACIDALVIENLVTPFDSRCATSDGPSTTAGPCQLDPPDQFTNDLWFRYTAECSGVLIAVVKNADFDAYVSIYCDGTDVCDCPTEGSEPLACGPGGIDETAGVYVSGSNCYMIRVGGLDGAVGTGELSVGCIHTTFAAVSFPQPGPETVPTNRFITFRVTDTLQEAIEVRFTSLPAPYDVFDSLSLWLGPPRAISENAGVVSPDDSPDDAQFMVSELQCEPHFMDWSLVGKIHAFHRLIVPGGRYTVLPAERLCYFLSQPNRCSNGAGCWPHLDSIQMSLVPFETSRWGDVVADCSTDPCGVPDGSVDVVTDVTAILDKFRNVADGLSKPRADLEPETPDLIINISDVAFALEAFRGLPYAFVVPGDWPCPK